MTEGPKIPPNLSRIVNRYDHYGDPRPEYEFKADITRRAALKRGDKDKKFARDSHWSVRREWTENGFLITLIELLGWDEAYKIACEMKANRENAASQMLQRARARKVLTDAGKGKGRRRTPEQLLVAMMVSVEALVGGGLRLEQALDRASDKWGHDFERFKDIYHKEAKLPDDGGRKMLRAFFYKTKVEEVDRFIEDFQDLETVSE